MSQLSDQELIQLVQEKLPEELTESELDQLRVRLRVSAELRDTLIDQLHLEGYLTEALGRFEVSVEKIMSLSGPGGGRRFSRFGLILFIGLLGSILSIILYVTLRPPVVPPDEVAQKEEKRRQQAVAKQAEVDPAAEKAKLEKSSTISAVAALENKPSPDKTTTTTKAAPSPVTAPVRLWRKEFEGESFARGNVKVDRANMGKDIGVIYADDAKPVYAEWDIVAPQGGRYQLDLRYAAKTTRPLKLVLNGQAVMFGIARSTTRDWKPKDQAWFPVGLVELREGKNSVRLESDPPVKQKRLGQFPALDKLSLTSTFEITVPLQPSETTQPKTPWDALVQQGQPSLKLEDVAFAPRGEQWGLRREVLQQWLEPVPNVAHAFHESQHGEMTLAGFDGLLKLRAPWPADAVMRISPYDHFGLRLHFWNGDMGVTFQFSDRPMPSWGAYLTTRTNNSPKPASLVLAGGAEGRFDPLLHGPVEFRHQNGQLILSRGDLRLITIPCAESPSEMYLEGRSWFSGFAMYRGAPLPAEDIPARSYLLRSERPGELNLTSKLSMGARSVTLPDGGLELTAEKTTEISTVSIALEKPGLNEIVLQIQDATPGTGIVLGYGDSQPAHRLAFCRETNTKTTCLSWHRPQELHIDQAYDLQHQIVPYTAPIQWIRIVPGIASLKCWLSADGVHWGRALEPLRPVRGGCVEIGLYTLPGAELRRIKLRHLEVRELKSLTSIVPDELLTKAPRFPGDLQVEEWLENAISSQPADVDAAQWRQACALNSLSLGCGPELGKILLAGLIGEVIVRPSSPSDRVRFLQDAALIAETWDHAEGLAFAEWFDKLGHQLIQESHPQACVLVTQALLNCPLNTTAPIRVPSESLVRFELMRALYRSDWKEVAALCRWTRFWNKPSHPHYQPFQGREALRGLIDLAEAGVERMLPDQKRIRGPRAGDQEPVLWRHPLIEQLSKEGYNVLAEFEAALGGDSFRDACQIVVAASSSGALGLLPDTRDRDLLVSLPQSVELAMREHPELQKTMVSQFGPIGRVRVRQAIADGNGDAVLAATLQFNGTEAAAEAHAWLGDRSLSVGHFIRAIGQYQRASMTASASLRPELQAKLRLVSALAGRPKLLGEPATTAVVIGEQRLEPGQFEQLVAEFRRQTDAAIAVGNTLQGGDAGQQTLPGPTGYQIERRFAFDGTAGRNAGNTHYAGTDTAGREFTIRSHGNWLLTSNRFQVTAYDLVSGQRKWNTTMKDEEGDAHNFPLLPMPPVFHGNRVFVRRLGRQGPELACLDLNDGSVQWSKKLGSHVVSDPLVIEDALFAFYVEEPQIGLLQVSLANLDVQTGEVISQSNMLQFRDVWGTKVLCQATAAGDKIVASIGGSVLCCDLLGRQLWLRRQTWLPPSDQNGFFRQFRQPPLVLDGRVYLCQPGVQSAECLDLETGRLQWQFAGPEIRRVVGVVEGHVIVESNSGLHALDVKRGEQVWARPLTNVLEAQLVGKPGGILVARSLKLRAEQRRVCLTWLDSRTGQDSASTWVPEFQDKDPQLTAILPVKDRLWVAWGRNPRDFKRELVELVPQGAATRTSAGYDRSLFRWTSHVPTEVQDAVGEFLPGWLLLTRQTIQQSGHEPEFQGLKDVLQTQSIHARPVIFARLVHVSKEHPGKLRIHAAVTQGQPWQLAVRVNDQIVNTWKMDDQTPNRVGQYDVDLTPFSGQSVWLQIAQDSLGRSTSNAYWKSLELID